MRTILKAEGVRHSYAGQRVLEIASLDIFYGETLCLLGHNGAGKSTLVRLLNLLEKPDAGKLWFDGAPVTTGSAKARRRMAAVFQRPHMFRGTVRENVAYGLKLRRQRDHGGRGVDGNIELLGLSHMAGKNARRLSGGEAQRVALARALAVNPEVLFLDEPASSLDPHARAGFLRELRIIVKESRMTVIYVTHSLDEALAAGDRMAVLCEGAIHQIGPSLEVFHAPASTVMARFLGVRNILPGVVVDRAAGGAVVQLQGGSHIFTRCAASGAVSACIRGEDVTLHPPFRDDEPSLTANRFTGLVESLVPAGGACQLVLNCGFTLEASVARPVVRQLALEEGARVEVRFDEAAVHLIESGGAMDDAVRSVGAAPAEAFSDREGGRIWHA